jgi:hypothetical protein
MKIFLPLLIIAALVAGCSKSGSDHAGHDHHHHHTAPHGGTLVELGDHLFNVELVRDAAAGKLSLYVLDAHAENFVRTALPGIALTVQAGAATHTLPLLPVANAATGETVGDTALYEATAAWLTTTATFTGEIPRLELKGRTFTNVKFSFPDNHAGHNH